MLVFVSTDLLSGVGSQLHHISIKWKSYYTLPSDLSLSRRIVVIVGVGIGVKPNILHMLVAYNACWAAASNWSSAHVSADK